MDFIENDQPIGIGAQKTVGVLQLGAVDGGFKIEIDGWTRLRDGVGQGGLADLARTKQRYGRLAGKRVFNGGNDSSDNHPRNLSKR